VLGGERLGGLDRELPGLRRAMIEKCARPQIVRHIGGHAESPPWCAAQ